MVSDSALRLPLRNYPLFSMGVASKEDIYNDLKRLLKCFSLFQLPICAKLNFLHML